MSTRWHLSYFGILLCLLVVAVVSGCSSRKVVTSSGDQRYVPGAKASLPAAPPPVKEARVTEQPVAPAPPPQPPVPQTGPSTGLSDIFFDFDRFAIRDDARSGLEVNAGLLKSRSGEKILIAGHCDERGTSAYNLVLGERRAQAAARYLQDLGVSSSQMQITSYGKERPFCDEHSEACWQSNRRAHFTR